MRIGPIVLTPQPATSLLRTIGRVLFGVALAFAGTTHLTVARAEFVAQVPTWLPLPADFVVVASGVVEIVLGLSLILLPRWRVVVGFVVAAFFIAIFPGNVSQWVTGTDAFGLNSDTARFIRLFFQPVLVVGVLWATAAWRDRHVLLSTAAVERDREQRPPDAAE
jgi:uncharacterized membrane protein